MFNLFSRKKVEDWELGFLINLFSNLGGYYLCLLDHINAGVLSRVRIEESQSKSIVYFGFADNVNEFEKRLTPSYKVNDIVVYEENTQSRVYVEVTIADGLVALYKMPYIKKHRFNPNTVDVSKCFITNIGTTDFNLVENILHLNLNGLVSPNDVFLIKVLDKSLYQLKEIGDGNFIGVDLLGKLYKVNHDLQDVIPLDGDVLSILRSDSK